MEENGQDGLKKQFFSRFRWAATGLMNTTYLAYWIVLQWIINRVKSIFPLVGSIDEWTFFTFQILFAASTLAPIAFFILQDIWRMGKRMWNEIKPSNRTTSGKRKRLIKTKDKNNFQSRVGEENQDPDNELDEGRDEE